MLVFVINIINTTPINPNGNAKTITNGCLNDLNNGVIIKKANKTDKISPNPRLENELLMTATSPSKLTS
jgi:hypothetical protein